MTSAPASRSALMTGMARLSLMSSVSGLNASPRMPIRRPSGQGCALGATGPVSGVILFTRSAAWRIGGFSW
jgi:hypothetical protein